MKKGIRAILIILSVMLAMFMSAIVANLAITADAKLQPEKLYKSERTISIFDRAMNQLEYTDAQNTSGGIKIEKLNKDTINAFIASEDRQFYKHNGINLKRMIKALYTNITSSSFKEGASTISQQLIKNTHLSSDKTLTRKLKEIKICRQLERKYTKDEILEMYLNTIYFGHNCYGLENAAKFYFGKAAEDLDLEQSATIVGLLTSPNNYSPFKNETKCISRRNIVLKAMRDCNFIDEETYNKTIKLPLSAERNDAQSKNSAYIKAVFDEFSECGIEPYSDTGNLIIETYLNQDIQTIVENTDFKYDGSIFIRNNAGEVIAFVSTTGNVRRQIGSTAKPIFVYAPALEEKIIQPFTKIADEKINYSGYSPENFDKKYHGSVSVEDSIIYSYNIPAVKTLNSLTVNKAAKYAEKMNIELKNEDKNLSLALGCTTDGITLKELCDCYSTFPNGGNYTTSKLIKRISDDKGKVLYEDKEISKQRVFNESTCSLINDMLIKTAQTGTAKKLAKLNYNVACKTGTCGTSEGNTDAYATAYTSDYTIGIWAGSKDNEKLEITGGGYCCKILNTILSSIYANDKPQPLDTKSGTVAIELDKQEYENYDKIILCDDNCPKLNRITFKCSKDNVPAEKSQKFTKPNIIKPTISVNNNLITVLLCQTKYYSYLVKRKQNEKIVTIYDGEWQAEISDAPDLGEYEYSITPYYSDGTNIFYGDEIVLPKIIINANQKDEIPNIANKNWYDR